MPLHDDNEFRDLCSTGATVELNLPSLPGDGAANEQTLARAIASAFQAATGRLVRQVQVHSAADLVLPKVDPGSCEGQQRRRALAVEAGAAPNKVMERLYREYNLNVPNLPTSARVLVGKVNRGKLDLGVEAKLGPAQTGDLQLNLDVITKVDGGSQVETTDWGLGFNLTLTF